MTSVLERLEALNEGATEGPWEATMALIAPPNSPAVASCVQRAGESFEAVDARAALIAASRNALPDLLAVVTAAKDMDEWLRRFTEEPEPGKPGFAVRNNLRRALVPLLREAE